MENIKLEENLKYLLQDINSIRPKREGKFITRVLLKSPPSREQLKIDPFVYIPEQNKIKKMPKQSVEENLDENEDLEKIEAKN